MKVGVCVTTYREPSALAMYADLKYVGFEVFSVDAEAYGVKRGIAPCMVEAWRMALKADCRYIIQMDAGGSHNPSQAPRLLTELFRGGDMAIGSRFMEGSKYIGNPKRAAMSRFASLMCNLKRGVWFTDWSSGYRAFTKEALGWLSEQPYYSKMHGFQLEVLGHALQHQMLVYETPITYLAGRSSFNSKVALEAFRVWRSLK